MTINIMVKSGHPLMALATLALNPSANFAEITNLESTNPLFVEKKALSEALKQYPTLNSALFPRRSFYAGSTRRSAKTRDIFSYQGDISLSELLAHTSPVKLDKLFGTSELQYDYPHFSSQALLYDSFVDSLDIYYYLTHSRPAEAFRQFCVDREFATNGCGKIVFSSFGNLFSLVAFDLLTTVT